MLSFLKSRAFMILLGLDPPGLFIWYGGPYFAFADYQSARIRRPPDSWHHRPSVGVVVVRRRCCSRRLRANRASDKLVTAVVKQANADQGNPSADAVQLRERFEEAVATLKQKRRSGHSLYDLPWYVIIGALVQERPPRS
jgi:type VI secretion system protein ImpL